VAARIQIVAVGRLDAQLRPVFEHYRRLLGATLDLRVHEVREVPLRGRQPAEVLREEARRLATVLEQAGRTVALDAAGRAPDSMEFARCLATWLEGGGVTFVFGGSLGLHEQVKAHADELLSLSRLTLPHQLARVVLVEQVFRAVKIGRGESYHH
jgi:23S rRNA (pseudouridine1915-N3)-methyltransferase